MKAKVESLQHQDYPSNISPDVRQAIKQLHHMKKIVIRQADKGSCTVIVDREQYLREGHEHLEDPKTYQQCAADRTVEIAHKANWAVEHHHKIGTISKYYRSQLLTNTEQVRTQHLYFLRKVHKHPHRLRPIVSASSGPTERISGHLVRMLGPYLKDIPSLVGNSLEVVNMLEGLDLSQNPDLLLVTFDVQSFHLSHRDLG